jgi:acyl-coenzyme A thioesterase PaaI-like protein
VRDTGEDHDDETELLAAVTELGSALRELVEMSVTTAVPAAGLRAAAEQARAISAQLASARRSPGELASLDGGTAGRRVYNPISGVGSAVAPPLTYRPADGGVVSETTLGVVYEGPTGLVHGGVIGLLADELLARAAAAADAWGMTARLEIDYRRPVPLGTPLVLRARTTEVAGRKTVVTGTVALAEEPDVPLAEARGLFIQPRPGQQP